VSLIEGSYTLYTMKKSKKVFGFVAVLAIAMVMSGFTAMASADITSESDGNASSAINYDINDSFMQENGLPTQVALKENAYHYKYSLDGINDNLYTEWWYFNVYNEEMQFLVCYLLFDPGNLTGIGDAEVLAVVYDGMPLIGFTSTSVSDFTADYEKPNVTIGSNTLLALNDTTVVVNGSCYDIYLNIPIQWNLRYTMDVGSWFGAPEPMLVGHRPDDWMQWLSYMTGANVQGTITIGGITYNMSGRGYHDHNWGEWLFDDPYWNWAQVSVPEENVSLILGDVIVPPARNIMMAKAEELVYSLNQGGFSEYTTHVVHTIYGRVLNAEGALVTVTNARTGVSKQSTVASGYYSVDGDFLDYLINDSAPWVADGDIMHIEAVKNQNRGNTTLIVNMSVDKQQATDISLQPLPE